MEEVIKKIQELNKRLDTHDKRFDAHDKRFDQLDKQSDLLARTVLNHTERLDRIEQNMATKTDLAEVSKTLDRLVTLAEKKDQELTALTYNQRLLSDRVDVAENNIKQMKPLLGLT